MVARRSLAEEWEALSAHRAWLAHYKSVAPKGVPPSPGYKDCPNCPLRAQSESEDERRSICRSCPFGHLPDSPSMHFLFIEGMASYPDYILAACVDDMKPHEHQEVAMMRRWWDAEKESRMMMSLWGAFGG